MDLLEAKNTALSFLKVSNKEIMGWFRTNMTVESKSDQSPVTIADRKAEEILRKKISKPILTTVLLAKSLVRKAHSQNGCGQLTRLMAHIHSYVDCPCLPH